MQGQTRGVSADSKETGLDWRGLLPRIEKEERTLAHTLAALHFLVIAAFTMARVARDGLLLSKLSAESLPYIYLGLAAGMFLSAWAFGRLTAGAAAHRSLSLALSVTGASVLLFSLWFRLHETSAAVGFYLWTGAYGPLLVSEVWSLVNERVNPRQARRLFGWIGAGGILGGVVGGGLPSLSSGWLPPQGLLLLVAAIHFGTARLAGRSGLREGESAPETGKSTAPEDPGIGGALRLPYVRLLVLLFLAGGLSSSVLDYLFKLAVQQRAEDARHITAIVGAFYGIQSLIALVAQLGLASAVMSRFGARTTAILLPGGVLGGSVLTLLWPAFPAVMGLRLYEATLRISVARTAWEFLFYPLPDALRRPAKRFVDGVVGRSAEAMGGVLILGLNAAFGGGIAQLAALSVVLTVAWLIAEGLVSRAYTAEISSSLDRMLPDGRPEPASVDEPGAEAELLQLLGSSKEREVLYALKLLQSVAPDALQERSAQLLGHPSEAVRNHAQSHFDLRKAALSTDPLQTPDPSAQKRPAAAHRGPERKTVAPDRLAAFFDDPDPEVRHNAYRSAALSGDRHHVTLLLERLCSAAERKHAREALVSYGDRIVGTLGDHLVDPAAPLQMRREIPRVLGAIGTHDAAASLLRAANLGEGRPVVYEVLRALNRIRSVGEIRPPDGALGSHIRTEVELYLRLLLKQAAICTIPEEGPRKLLQQVMGEDLDQSLELVFRRLALLYPSRDVLLALRGMKSPNARLRAQSMEVLENLLEPEHKLLVIPLLEEQLEERVRKASEQLQADPPTLVETLRELAEAREPWLQACALFAIGTLRLAQLRELIRKAQDSAHPTVQEMAAWAERQIDNTA